MKNLSLALGRATLVLAIAFSLGACGRAGYAPLLQAATPPASTPVAQAPYVPVAAEASASVTATAPMPPATLSPIAVLSPATAAAPVAAPAVVAVPPVKAAAAPKLNIGQRLALRSVAKKLDKLTSKMPQLKQQDAAAARGGLDSNLRSALLFGLIGIILALFGGVSNIFYVLGTVLIIVGLVFLVLWLLDQA